ncbi:hypothetical protein [uncultured Clostridium sp.]|jgi:hypothetical protein|uniref:hypothetical protein n=1 Tax=uncultured Clostridium sp. TaxID=59620 RepID=UPI002632DA40|nr:hypothetical protein [uncultured Clostridium sp.]
MALLEMHHYDHHTTELLARTKGIKRSELKPTHKILVELPSQVYGQDGFEIVEGYLKLECRLDISCFDDIKKVIIDILKYNETAKKYKIAFVTDTIVERAKNR